jgi:hypothetical protein
MDHEATLLRASQFRAELANGLPPVARHLWQKLDSLDVGRQWGNEHSAIDHEVG